MQMAFESVVGLQAGCPSWDSNSSSNGSFESPLGVSIISKSGAAARASELAGHFRQASSLCARPKPKSINKFDAIRRLMPVQCRQLAALKQLVVC